MRWTSVLVTALTTASLLVGGAPAQAQGKTATKKDDKKKKGDDAPEEPKDDRKWSTIEETAENLPEDQQPDAPPDDNRGASPYRPPATDDVQVISGFEDDEPKKTTKESEYSESVAWMENWTPRYASSRAGLEYDLYVGSEAASLMTWDLGFQLAFGEEETFTFGATLPFGYVRDFGAVIGNPVISLLGGGKLHEQVGLWGGLRIAIPTLPSADLLGADTANLASKLVLAPLRAGVELHRFFPLSVPVRLPFGGEFQLHPLVYLRVEIDPTLFFPTQSGGANSVVMDQINELEVLSPIGLGGGIRLQESFILTNATDRAQVGLEPFLSYEPPTEGDYAVPVYARLGLMMALDSPFGFAFDTNKIATLRFAVGAKF
ncbi:MAG: hypothetical protein R3B72_46950 [Polyangiaceae bacterium]